MANLTTFSEKVLRYLEPDESRWSYWLEKQELQSVSEATCIHTFVDRIQNAREQNKKVIVCGDYDCDGILATTIMVDGLQKYGLEVGFYIPDRIKEGYGLNCNTVSLAHKKGYELLVTVDNGVKAHDALSFAKESGMETIVTDHHRIEEEICCDVLVHPSKMEESFSTLCGAAVAYECIRALGVDTPYHLILASIASVGDVMPVTHQTRALIQNGLQLLNTSKEKHTYILANDGVLNETSVGFQIVPKLNAIGRLSNMANVNNAVRYFLNQDEREIRRFYDQIVHVNDLRKQISTKMTECALRKCTPQDPVLLVCDPSFHEGIIGLVAGSLCSQFQKPAIVMAQNTDSYKASMRSPEGFDCMDFLSGFDDFRALGGHTQAAGFSLDLQSFPAFVKYVKEAGATFDWTPLKKNTLHIEPEDITTQSVQSLDALRPFGPGFQLPAFEISPVNIKSVYDLSNGKHQRFTLQSGLQCLCFNISAADKAKSVNSIRGFVGSPQINYYRGSKRVSFIIDQILYK